jgi:predicted SAM-dependent methyltransferase|tara:strand:- start:205 stop:798 length:594 start_codon:yes stop_codon:yes gene_type:complete
MNGITQIPEQQSILEFLEERSGKSIKLHLGCGGVRWKDFVNVDLHPHSEGNVDSSRGGCVADVFADIRNLNLQDNYVDEIFSAHVLEHFTKWEALQMLTDWVRMLKPGGILRIETPDFLRCVFWLFHPSKKKRDLAERQFYGNQWDGLDYETHRFVWSARQLRDAFRDAGLVNVHSTHQVWTHHKWRDMRVEGQKRG